MASHYQVLKIEPIDFMWANMTKEELTGFFKGNITKYAYRKKGQDLQDAQKIQVYARWLELLHDPSQVDEQRALYRLINQCKQVKDEISVIVSAGRGGAYVAAKVAYALDKPLNILPSIEETEWITPALFIDDIEDTSKTIEKVKNLWKNVVYTGVLVQKRESKKLADFVGYKTDYKGYIKFTFQED